MASPLSNGQQADAGNHGMGAVDELEALATQFRDNKINRQEFFERHRGIVSKLRKEENDRERKSKENIKRSNAIMLTLKDKLDKQSAPRKGRT